MGVNSNTVLEVVCGWEAVELIVRCVFIGLWQLIQLAVKRLWKGHRRKLSNNYPAVEFTVDSSIGIHCYIKVMGVKYHYVETGPKYGKLVLILGDAPDTRDLWVPSWSSVVRRLAETDHHVVTLDLRGTGGSEGGHRGDLSPPRAVEELTALLEALGASENNPALMIGFGIGGMLTWYVVHCRASLVSKFAVISAPHPNLYWQHPPAAFCHQSLHFIQWPSFPERWLAEGALQEGSQWSSSRAQDWSGALNYVRGPPSPRSEYITRLVVENSRTNGTTAVARARDGRLRVENTPETLTDGRRGGVAPREGGAPGGGARPAGGRQGQCGAAGGQRAVLRQPRTAHGAPPRPGRRGAGRHRAGLLRGEAQAGAGGSRGAGGARAGRGGGARGRGRGPGAPGAARPHLSGAPRGTTPHLVPRLKDEVMDFKNI